MGLENKTAESFSELLDLLIETVQTGDLSAEQMTERDKIKQRLIVKYAWKHSFDHQPMGGH